MSFFSIGARAPFSFSSFFFNFALVTSCLGLSIADSAHAEGWFKKRTPASNGPVIPEVTFLGGPPSVEEKEAAEGYRASLIKVVDRWKALGMKKPPDIDAFVVILSYEGETINSVLQKFNPGIDIAAHVEKQYRHFEKTSFFRLLTLLEKQLKQDPGTLTTRFFDTYANFRYGYSVPNFYEAVKNNTLLDELKVDSDLAKPKDNAYYGRFPMIDLTSSLPLEDAQGKITSVFLTFVTGKIDSISLYRLNLMSNEGMSSRIVILPRLTQEKGSIKKSTLRDRKVGAHEVGHSINATEGEVPRTIDEAMGDYIAASEDEDPLIGAVFAEISGEIARALENSPDVDERFQAKRLREMADEGSLRDMRRVVSMDEIGRRHLIDDNYTGGHPIRTFLWKMRKESGADLNELDRTALSAIGEMSRIPLHVSDQALTVINLRQLRMSINADKAFRKTMLELLAANPGELVEDKQKELQYLAREAVEKKITDAEAANVKRRMERVNAGEVVPRAATTFDYIHPEYFRAFYRTALKFGYKDLAEKVMKYAGEVMKSTPRVLTTKSGHANLVFYRRPDHIKDDAITARLLASLERLEVLGKQFPKQDPKSSDEALRAELTKYEQKYFDALSRIQEFERTGSRSKLDNPWPSDSYLRKLTERINKSCQAQIVTVGESDDEGQLVYNAAR